MDDPTSKNVGKLYAFFLEVSKEIVKFKLYQELKVPREGHRMYEELVQRLRGGCIRVYKRYIWNFENLDNYSEKFLTPEENVIDVKKLNISMYAKIIQLLSRDKQDKVMKYLIKKRNYLCH